MNFITLKRVHQIGTDLSMIFFSFGLQHYVCTWNFTYSSLVWLNGQTNVATLGNKKIKIKTDLKNDFIVCNTGIFILFPF